MELFAARETPNRRVFQEKIFPFFRPMDTKAFHHRDKKGPKSAFLITEKRLFFCVFCGSEAPVPPRRASFSFPATDNRLQTPDCGLLPAGAGRTDLLTSAPGGGILTIGGNGVGQFGDCHRNGLSPEWPGKGWSDSRA